MIQRFYYRSHSYLSKSKKFWFNSVKPDCLKSSAFLRSCCWRPFPCSWMTLMQEYLRGKMSSLSCHQKARNCHQQHLFSLSDDLASPRVNALRHEWHYNNILPSDKYFKCMKICTVHNAWSRTQMQWLFWLCFVMSLHFPFDFILLPKTF